MLLRKVFYVLIFTFEVVYTWCARAGSSIRHASHSASTFHPHAPPHGKMGSSPPSSPLAAWRSRRARLYRLIINSIGKNLMIFWPTTARRRLFASRDLKLVSTDHSTFVQKVHAINILLYEYHSSKIYIYILNGYEIEISSKLIFVCKPCVVLQSRVRCRQVMFARYEYSKVQPPLFFRT